MKCICVVHLYKSYLKSRTFIWNHSKEDTKDGIEVGQRIERALKSLLQGSGYSEKASNEVCKWYTFPMKKGKATKKWHSRAMLIDLRKAKLTIINSETAILDDN